MRTSILCLTAAMVAVGVAADEGRLVVTLTSTTGEPVEDAIVSATPLDGAPPPFSQAGEVEIAQEGEEYVPYVTAVRVGTTVDFPNRDKVQHHLYSLSKPKRFEKPLYASGAKESVVFDKPGLVVLGCNIHDWMVGYVVVLETPYFAKSDSTGKVEIRGLPSGRYRIEVWQPRLAAPVRRELAVGSGTAAEAFSLRLKPDRRIRRAPDGKGSGY